MGTRFTTIVLVSLALLLGCSEDSKKKYPVADPYKKQTSIANCLYNLKLAYNQRDIEKYKALVHEQYTYVFDPRDVGHAGIPESWGRADDILSATRLFGGLPNADGYVAQTITLDFEVGLDVQSGIDPHWRDVTLSQVRLLIDCIHQSTEEPLRYEMLGDQADLSFVQTDEIDPDSELRLWKIIYWVDKPVHAKTGTNPATWGRIKAAWR
jgi:hypothetical protein